MRTLHAPTPSLRLASQHGIAIGPILFVIALLAILATAISAGSGTFTLNSDQEKAEKMADSILAYAEDFRAGTSRVLLGRGCTDTQISFENSVTTLSYTNSNAPPDKRCHVFDMAGGGVTGRLPIVEWLDSTYSASSYYQQWHIPSNSLIAGVGLSTYDGLGSYIDLVLIIPYIRQDICTAINKRMGYTGVIPSAIPIMDSGHFVGTYYAGGGYTIAPGSARLLRTGCRLITLSSQTPYAFYSLLWAR